MKRGRVVRGKRVRGEMAHLESGLLEACVEGLVTLGHRRVDCKDEAEDDVLLRQRGVSGRSRR